MSTTIKNKFLRKEKYTAGTGEKKKNSTWVKSLLLATLIRLLPYTDEVELVAGSQMIFLHQTIFSKWYVETTTKQKQT